MSAARPAPKRWAWPVVAASACAAATIPVLTALVDTDLWNPGSLMSSRSGVLGLQLSTRADAQPVDRRHPQGMEPSPRPDSASFGPGSLAAPEPGRGWSLAAWVMLALLVVGQGVCVLVTAAWIWLGGAAVCQDPPDLSDMASAQRGLAVLTAVAVGPWLLASVWVRPRVLMVLAGVLASSPAWFAFFTTLNEAGYRLNWCYA
jgi:hypothetical protein